MRLRELEHVIENRANVSIQTNSNNGLPIMYDSWEECKKHLKGRAWDEEVELRSYSGIQIYFKNM